jgi:hypothetical protein
LGSGILTAGFEGKLDLGKSIISHKNCSLKFKEPRKFERSLEHHKIVMGDQSMEPHQSKKVGGSIEISAK